MARQRPKPETFGAVDGPEEPLEHLASIAPERRDLESVRLDGTDLERRGLRGLRMVDVEAEGIVAANGDWGGALLRRVCFRGARLTGLNLGEAKLEDARFVDCKLDYANFRHATIDHVSFEGCVLSDADFQGAEIYATAFPGSRLQGTDFTKAELAHVDLRGAELAPGGSLLGLRGAIVDSLQLIDLAPQLAAELGIAVEDPD